jgi:hypothetical protein
MKKEEFEESARQLREKHVCDSDYYPRYADLCDEYIESAEREISRLTAESYHAALTLSTKNDPGQKRYHHSLCEANKQILIMQEELRKAASAQQVAWVKYDPDNPLTLPPDGEWVVVACPSPGPRNRVFVSMNTYDHILGWGSYSPIPTHWTKIEPPEES